MPRIGFLLPRSTEYTSMSFDLLDGFKLFLMNSGVTDYTVCTENIGFGEDPEAVHAAAEKLVLNNDVDLIVAYATSLNAELLYPFAENTGKPMLFLDAGMDVFEQPPHSLCYHLTLQGLQASETIGHMAGSSPQGAKTVAATSFLDGGYRSSWFTSEAVTSSGGTICGYFVSGYLPQEFSLAPLEETIRTQMGETVVASFSSYLAALFLQHLGSAGATLKSLPLYASAFLAEETILDNVPYPGVTLTTVVPWARTLDNAANLEFIRVVKEGKNKPANIFHLLGWEAAAAVQQMIQNGHASLDGWSMESPRGTMRFDPETHCAYAPLYEGKIAEGNNQRCTLVIDKIIPVSAEAHRKNHFAKPDGQYTRWKNNFFCI